MEKKASSLEEKLALSKRYFDDICQEFNPGLILVAWTGGKDSTLVLWLWKLYLETISDNQLAPKALTVDTGLKFEEMLDFRGRIQQEWSIELFIARPDVDLETYPIATDPIQCCTDLKIRPLKDKIRQLGGQVLLSGVRADEHPSRHQRFWKEQRQDPDYLQVNPILYWTEMDVWSFHLSRDIPYCPLYDQGYRSLGCRPCTNPSSGDERSGRNEDKERYLNLLSSLGYF